MLFIKVLYKNYDNRTLFGYGFKITILWSVTHPEVIRVVLAASIKL
jgi:hypothetical protein